jgi:arginase family enzyme
MHAGIRAPLIRKKGDLRNDVRCGFDIVRARDIDRIGIDGVIRKLKERVAGTKVYISVDIDVLDPAFAPGKHFILVLIERRVSVKCSCSRMDVLCSAGRNENSPEALNYRFHFRHRADGRTHTNRGIFPATGTSEVGGWTTRELLSILDGLEGIEVIGADVGMTITPAGNELGFANASTVEVAPIYDNPGETTVLAAAEVAYSLLTLMVQTPVKDKHST